MSRISTIVTRMTTLVAVLTACSSNATVSLISEAAPTSVPVDTAPTTNRPTSTVATTEAEARCMKAAGKSTLVAAFTAPAASVVNWQEHRDDGRTLVGGLPLSQLPSRWRNSLASEPLTICYYDGSFYAHGPNDNPPLTRMRLIIDNSGTVDSDGGGYAKASDGRPELEIVAPSDAKVIKRPA